MKIKAMKLNETIITNIILIFSLLYATRGIHSPLQVKVRANSLKSLKFKTCLKKKI